MLKLPYGKYTINVLFRDGVGRDKVEISWLNENVERSKTHNK